MNRMITLVSLFSVSTRMVPLSLRRYHDNAERQMVLSDVQQKSQEEECLSGRTKRTKQTER